MEKVFNNIYFKKLYEKLNKEERVNSILKALKEIDKQYGINKEEALAVGTGFGFEVEALYRFGFKKVIGIDISEYAISIAKKLYPQWSDDFIVADIQHLKLYKKFDFILCLDVLEHVENPKKALQKIYEHLKDNGIAYIRAPNTFAAQLYYLLPYPLKLVWNLILGHPYIFDDNTHISELPPYRWEALFKETKFILKRLKIERIWLKGSKRLFGKTLYLFKKPFYLQYNLHYLLLKEA